MHFTVSSIAAAASVLLSAVAAERAACVPAADAFSLKSPDIAECTQTVYSSGDGSSFAGYSCGLRGSLQYDFKGNFIGIDGIILPSDGQFTIHGTCFDGHRQVAHVDLSLPRTAYKKYAHEFNGLNRICDIGSTQLKLKFWSYNLNPAQLKECEKHPIIPIGH